MGGEAAAPITPPITRGAEAGRRDAPGDGEEAVRGGAVRGDGEEAVLGGGGVFEEEERGLEGGREEEVEEDLPPPG